VNTRQVVGRAFGRGLPLAATIFTVGVILRAWYGDPQAGWGPGQATVVACLVSAVSADLWRARNAGRAQRPKPQR
jgi:hypothetical protein